MSTYGTGGAVCQNVAGIEFINDNSGRSYAYDINTNTEYNVEIEAADGCSGSGRLVEVLGRELVNEPERTGGAGEFQASPCRVAG